MTFTPTYLDSNLSELWLICDGFDDLLLTGTTVDDDGHEYEIMARGSVPSGPVSALSWGNAEPLDVAVSRWMTDGAVASTQGFDDRMIEFPVRVSAGTSVDLAAGEAALQQRAEGVVTLRWIPPEGEAAAPATDFVVWTWHLAHGFDITDELRMSRLYGVTATAEPWAKSAVLSLVEAIVTSDSPTTTTIDNCSSATGWAGTLGAATEVSGSVTVTAHAAPGSLMAFGLKRTGSVTGLGSTPYIVLDLSVAGGTLDSLTATVDGAAMSQVSQIDDAAYFQLPTGVTAFTTLDIRPTVKASGAVAQVIALADLLASDTIGGVGSQKQLLRSLDVGGSVETAGSIQIASPDSTPLGTVLVYTAPANGLGYTATLRQYRTTGNTQTSDTDAVSGFHEGFSSGGVGAGLITYTLPPHVLPECTALILGRFHSSVATTITVTGSISTGTVGGDGFGGAVTWDSAGWVWANLGVVPFPALRTPLESLVTSGVLFEFAGGGSGTQTLDELYLLDITHGDATLVDCGTDATMLRLDAPDIDLSENRKAVYLGTQADWSDAAAAPGSQIIVPGDHTFDPRGAMLLTVTDGVDDAVVTASFFQRWNTHAAA